MDAKCGGWGEFGAEGDAEAGGQEFEEGEAGRWCGGLMETVWFGWAGGAGGGGVLD